jgi:hypothetical protein
LRKKFFDCIPLAMGKVIEILSRNWKVFHIVGLPMRVGVWTLFADFVTKFVLLIHLPLLE